MRKRRETFRRRDMVFVSIIIVLILVIISNSFAEGDEADDTDKYREHLSENTEGSIKDIGDEDKAEYMINVPYICQNPDFPTGCESVSAVMVLQYYGLDISVDEFVDNYLELGDYYWDVEGIMHGPDPQEKYVGNPRELTGFGCYAPVIENAVKHVVDDERIKLTTGSGLEELCHEYVDRDIPVLVWASMGMKPTSDGYSWLLDSGEEFTWIAGEHCLVLVGYDREYYYFNDPIEGKEVAYEKWLVEQRYEELGKQSLVIKK